MTTEQDLVKTWMQIYNQETPDKPIIPCKEIRYLRAKLILEEALECIEALGFIPFAKENIYEDDHISIDNIGLWEDKVILTSLENIADQLADLHYVAYCGTGVSCGLDMQPIFQEVHRANMSKFWPAFEIEQAPKDSNIVETKDHYFVVRDKHGKIIKPPSFKSPQLKEIIEKQAQ